MEPLFSRRKGREQKEGEKRKKRNFPIEWFPQWKRTGGPARWFVSFFLCVCVAFLAFLAFSKLGVSTHSPPLCFPYSLLSFFLSFFFLFVFFFSPPTLPPFPPQKNSKRNMFGDPTRRKNKTTFLAWSFDKKLFY